MPFVIYYSKGEDKNFFGIAEGDPYHIAYFVPIEPEEDWDEIDEEIKKDPKLDPSDFANWASDHFRFDLEQYRKVYRYVMF